MKLLNLLVTNPGTHPAILQLGSNLKDGVVHRIFDGIQTRYERMSGAKIAIEPSKSKTLKEELKKRAADHIEGKAINPIQIVINVILKTSSTKVLNEATKAI